MKLKTIGLKGGMSWEWRKGRDINIDLIKEAEEFSELQSKIFHNNLYEVTDGKKVGTYIEKLF